MQGGAGRQCESTANCYVEGVCVCKRGVSVCACMRACASKDIRGLHINWSYPGTNSEKARKFDTHVMHCFVHTAV